MTNSNQGMPSDDIRWPVGAHRSRGEPVSSPEIQAADAVDIGARIILIGLAWRQYRQAVAKRVADHQTGRRPL